MKPFLIFILIMVSMLSCGKSPSTVSEEKKSVETSNTISFQTNWVEKDTLSIYHYLDNIAYYTKDSSKVIQLAKRDAGKGAYFFMEFGLKAIPLYDESFYKNLLAHQKKICAQNNIWIFDMGCEDSETGRIYTREMKKILEQDKGLHYDSIFNPALVSF